MNFIKYPITLSILIFILFCLLGIYVTYPLIFHLGDFATGAGDEYLIAWIMDWNIHSFFSNPLHIFNANIFYPYTNTLAYSDTHFISSVLAIIPFLLIKQPISTINFTFLSSLILLGFSMCVLTKYVTKNTLLSIFIGILIMFSPAVLDKRTHLQILAIEWVPLAILFYIKFLQKVKLQYLLVSVCFFVIQTYNSFMPGYFILFAYVFLSFFYGLHQKSFNIFFTIRFILPLLFSLVILIPIIIPYYQVSSQFHFTRDIREAIHLALQPEDYLFPPNTTRLQPLLLPLQQIQTLPKNAETKPGYLGMMFTLLIIVSCMYWIIEYKQLNWETKSFLSIAATGFILSLGPALHFHRVTIHHPFLIPLPYAIFYYILPGFEGIRNSARWEMLFIIGILPVIALTIQDFFSRFPKKFNQIFIILCIIFSIAEFNFPLDFIQVPTMQKFPKVYSWLDSTPQQSVIIELPIYNWYVSPYSTEELQRVYFTTANFRKTVNGASGFSPQPWQDIVTTIWQQFPNDHSIKLLKKIGVNYVIIHKKEFDIVSKTKTADHGIRLKNGDSIITQVNHNPSLHLIKKIGDDYVYKLK